MAKEVNVFNLGKQPYDMDDQTFEVNFIENLTNEHSEELELEARCKVRVGISGFQSCSNC